MNSTSEDVANVTQSPLAVSELNASSRVLFASPSHGLSQCHAYRDFVYLWPRRFLLSRAGLSSKLQYTRRCILSLVFFVQAGRFHGDALIVCAHVVGRR